MRPRRRAFWKAVTRASCPRTRCHDTRHLLTDVFVNPFRAPRRVDDLDPLRPPPRLAQEPLTNSLMVSEIATLQTVRGAVAARQGRFQRQVEDECYIGFQ